MDFIDIYLSIWWTLDKKLFFLSAGIFLLGIFSAPWVIQRKLRFLTGYPMWVYRRLSEYLDHEHGFLSLFLLIFSLNAFSLFINLLSGWSGILPFLFAFWTGLNVAIVACHIGGDSGVLAIFVNPVAWIELPVTWLVLSTAMQLGIEIVKTGFSNEALAIFGTAFNNYVFVVIPLLSFAAFLEVTLIAIVRTKSNLLQ